MNEATLRGLREMKEVIKQAERNPRQVCFSCIWAKMCCRMEKDFMPATGCIAWGEKR